MSMVLCSGCSKEIHDLAIVCPQCGAKQSNPYSVGSASFTMNSSYKKYGFFDWFLKPMKQYAVFSGRTTRQEYWMFFLLSVIIAVAIGVIAGITRASWLSDLYTLAVFVPGIAIGVRRMHDTDRSGWWLIVPIAGFVFLLFASQPETNRFGPGRKMLA